MSDTAPEVSSADQDNIEKAATEYELFRKNIEENYGMGIAATSELTPDGRVASVLQLVKIVRQQDPTELSADDMRMAEVSESTAPTTPDNGNDETAQASPSDSPEQPAS